MTTKLFTIIAAVFALFVLTAPAFADEYVNGYFRQDGTYVQGYYRSSPNGTVQDNYSYKGNVNPYTGEVGTDRYIHDDTSPYYEGPNDQGQVGHGDSDPDSDTGDGPN